MATKDFITYSPNTGNKNATISVTASKNTGVERNIYLSINGKGIIKSISVKQGQEIVKYISSIENSSSIPITASPNPIDMNAIQGYCTAKLTTSEYLGDLFQCIEIENIVSVKANSPFYLKIVVKLKEQTGNGLIGGYTDIDNTATLWIESYNGGNENLMLLKDTNLDDIISFGCLAQSSNIVNEVPHLLTFILSPMEGGAPVLLFKIKLKYTN